LSGWFIYITKQNEHIQSIIVFIQFFQNFVKKIAFNLKMTISTNFFKEEFEVIEGLACESFIPTTIKGEKTKPYGR
jgi:hypothetical protein